MYVDPKGQVWYKGNLHTHTTRSDGVLTPEAAADRYRSKGYDFLALTDHRKFRPQQEKDGLLLLSGVEYDLGHDPLYCFYHIVAIGMEKDPLIDCDHMTPQEVIDGIRAAGGRAILAHPAWSLNRPDQMAALKRLSGAEIYNSVSALPWNTRPDSSLLIDELSTMGIHLPCMAADDSHSYQGEDCLSFLYVKAEACTREALLCAIDRGDFVASQGPFLQLKIEGDQAVVDCSPVSMVTFDSNLPWTPGRIVTGEGLTRAVYNLKPTHRFIRVTVYDKEGRKAWSSPLPITQ